MAKEAETVETNLTPEEEYAAYAENADQNDLADRGLAERPKAEEPPPPEKKETKPEAPKNVNRMGYREIREENERLRRELELARTPAKEEVKEEVSEKPAELRARPKPDDKTVDGANKYKSWEDYEDDLLEWHQEKVLRASDERSTKRTQEQQIEAVNNQIEQSWRERCEAAAEKHEDFAEAIDPNGIGKLIQPGSLVDEWIMDSEQGAELMYFFHKNPAELRKFERIDGPTPGARRAKVRRMLIEIENKLTEGAKSNEPEEETEQPEPAVEREPRVTKAPPPSRAIGGRGAQPVDRARAAVANDDVSAYIDEANAREIRQKFGDRRR